MASGCFQQYGHQFAILGPAEVPLDDLDEVPADPGVEVVVRGPR